MAIPKTTRMIVEALHRALTGEGTVAVVEMHDEKTGELCDAICGIVTTPQNETIIVPLVFISRENPLRRFTPTDTESLEANMRHVDSDDSDDEQPQRRSVKRPIGFIH